jgi:hypothetical protein
MTLTASLVVTTVFDPIVIEGYFDKFQHYGHLEQVQVYVIPDRKTPHQAYVHCQELSQRGMKVVCPTLEEQEEFLKRIGFPPHLVPYDSDNRRNIGYLMALESGSDFLVSIDDDNHCCPNEDFFLEHAVVCESDHAAEVVNAGEKWFNACSLLGLDRSGIIYPRGFPYYARHKTEQLEIASSQVDVHMNAGLWLLDPDVDGITWLVAPARVMSFTGQSLVLGQQTWSPINTQNTALRREVIASYYFVKMGYPLAGVPIDRYGDIFSGYFAQACVRHMGGAIRVGTPLAEHRRNSHNYMKDASNEWACILVLEDLLPWLTEEAKLEGTSYIEAYTSLSYAIEDAVECFEDRIWNDATRGYFHQMAYYMRAWVNACHVVSNKRE